MRTTRRRFLKTGIAASTGFVIWLEIPASSQPAPTTFEPNAYINITPDNVVRLWMTRSEMGQGVRTVLPMMLNEELEADWKQIRLEQAAPGGRFKGIRLRTSGSGSTVGTYNVLRKAGATARIMLVAAAADLWHVDPGECRAASGKVVHTPTGRKFSYGELASAAARQEVPKDPPLKEPKNFAVIGKPVKRSDGHAIVTGQAVYGLDIRVPGMLFAVMARCPYLGGKMARFDSSRAMGVPGVRHVVPIRSGIATGIAVVADHTWAAMQGREALHVEWERGPNAEFSSDLLLSQMKDALSKEGYYVRGDGDATTAIRSSAKVVDATYELPFQAHAPLETMNCVADVRPGSCEIWVATQAPERSQSDVAKLLGMPEDAVTIHVTLIGGGFGRRLQVDYVVEAAELSQAIGKPVKLMWTRSDDMRFGYFQPSDLEHVSGGLDSNGKPVAWIQRSVGSDLSVLGLPSAQDLLDPKYYYKDGDPWGSFDNPYNFPNLKADFVPINSPVPTGPWRAVMYPPTVFARESFLDEMAHAAGRDPLQFRLELLDPGDVLTMGDQKIDRSRLKRVLQVAAEKTSWKVPLAQSDGRDWGRGIACNVYDADCYIAQVAEASVGRKTRDLRVHRIVCAVDCGLAVNPMGLEGQAESGILWGLSATLHGRIDFKNGCAVQESYSDFEVIRMDEAPAIETYIVASEHPPGGFGETAVPPVAPAVANAVFAATGKRIRQLPITPEKLRA